MFGIQIIILFHMIVRGCDIKLFLLGLWDGCGTGTGLTLVAGWDGSPASNYLRERDGTGQIMKYAGRDAGPV